MSTKDIVDGIYLASDFLPLNDDGKPFDYLMRYTRWQLSDDIDAILAEDPGFQVISDSDRTHFENDEKQTFAASLIRLDKIIKNHIRDLDSNHNGQGYLPFPDGDEIETDVYEAADDALIECNQALEKNEPYQSDNPPTEFPKNQEQQRDVITIALELYCINERLPKFLEELFGPNSFVSASSLNTYHTIEYWTRRNLGATLLKMYPLTLVLSTVIYIAFVSDIYI